MNEESTKSLEEEAAGEIEQEGVEREIELKHETALDDMRAQLEAKTDEAKDYMGHLQRLQAEFENYKKRIDRDRDKTLATATKHLIEALLPVVDNFELALRAIDADSGNKGYVEGVRMVYAELMSVLDRQGLEKIAANGERFDPNFHEAVVCENSDDEQQDGMVIEVMREGYCLGGQVLRPTMVKVGKYRKE